MNKIKLLVLLIVGAISFNSCLEDDADITYVASLSGDFMFSNTFLNEYVLTSGTSGNLGERFTWNDADFDVQTNVNYELQKSIAGDFSDMEIVGTTSNNYYDISIGDMLGYAAEAGLDNDPSTPAPDNGDVAFRVRATVGTNASVEAMSNVAMLTLMLPEASSGGPVCDLEQIWLVGAGVPDAGWGWTSPVRLGCNGDNIYSGNVNFQNNGGADNNFRMFTSEGDWASGLNYPHYDGEGYTIDSNFEDAQDGDNNFAFVGTSGFYHIEINTVTKTITLSDPQSIGTCEFEILYLVGAGVPDAGWGWATPVELFCAGDGVYFGPVNLQNNGGADNNFRFFTSEGDWASGRNYPYYVDEGYTIDSNFEDAQDGDNNFAFTGSSGVYNLTLDTNTKTITLD
ncbi:SusE domain-containing protein [Flavobacteriaceae bacterium]|nr:SusE domain-containing protein [Flavobacteriaceae bacterium]